MAEYTFSIVLVGAVLINATAAADQYHKNTSKIFIHSGRPQTVALTTSWANDQLAWHIRGKAGTVSQGSGAADNEGTLQLTLETPATRVPVKLKWTVRPKGADAEARSGVIWALPADPFKSVDTVFRDLRVRVQFSNRWYNSIKHMPFDSHAWGDQDDSDRPYILFLQRKSESERVPIKKVMDQLPRASVLIIVNESANAKDEPGLFVSDPSAPVTVQRCKDGESAVWRDLKPQWLAIPPHVRLRLTKNFIDYELLGGYLDSQQYVYPIVLAAKDSSDRHLLYWALTGDLDAEDPRWPLLVRNSLVWAIQQQSAVSR